MTVRQAVEAADAEIRTDPLLAHTEHLVVVRDGRVLAAHAYGPRGLDEPGDIFSITKSVLSTLVGCAVSDGLLTIDATLGELLGGRVPAAHRQVRVRHLLTMTGGADPSGPYDIDEVRRLPGDWVGALLAAPRLSPPGAEFRYDNGAAHVLAAALAAAVGEDLADYAARRLFGPLGIGPRPWPRDPDGLPYGFGHLRLSPLDLVALGRLWLDGGTAPDGGRLFSADWAREATRAHTPGGPPERTGYGFLWWSTEMAGRTAFFAGGWAGQHLVVVPALRLITVTTGDASALAPGWRRGRELTPAIAAAASAP
ncbi:hypothetical protein GCM10027168_31910 [Streptomyces capparidis]